jgi:hypothetical protein
MTAAQLENVVAYRDDILIATDTGNIFVSGADLATKVMIGKAAFGETGDRPDAGVEGRFYYDTDLGALYIDNGSTWVNASVEGAVSPDPHAASHIRGATDEVDGDKLDIDWNPTTYSPATVQGVTTSVDELTSHLKGIDTSLSGMAAASHTHVEDDISDLGTYQEALTSASTLGDIGIVVPVDGSGCTVNTTVDGGLLTAAAVNAGGSGYQVDDILNVAGGTSGQVKVATLSGSAVATVTIETAGTGYSAATGAATTTTSTRSWSGTGMGALTDSSTLLELIQAINDDIAALA